RCDRARGTGRADESAKTRATVGAVQSFEDFFNHPTRDVVVPDRVSEFLELVEDDAVLAGLFYLPALVVDFLDVGFAAGGGDDFGADRFEPLEALARHLLGEDGDGGAAEQRAV